MITSLGAREEVYERCVPMWCITLHDTINNRFAKKAIEKGADGSLQLRQVPAGHAGG